MALLGIKGLKINTTAVSFFAQVTLLMINIQL